MRENANSREPLDVIAIQIEELWKKSDDQRLELARLLKEAKERVKAGEAPLFKKSFSAWCRATLPGRSDRDVRRLIQIASADDPEAAMAGLRAKAKRQSAAYRAKAKRQPAAYRAQKAKADSRESTLDDDIIEDAGAQDDADGADYSNPERNIDTVIDEIGADAMIDRAVAMFGRLRIRLPHEERITVARRVLEALGVEASELESEQLVTLN